MEDRFNGPDSNSFEIELLGNHLRFEQDPNSKQHGTTVWDASLVVAKYLEKNLRKGEFSQTKLKGKKAIELGAGCGLAGLAFLIQGCDVIFTDQSNILPILTRNLTRNLATVKMNSNPDACIGKMEVKELDWLKFDSSPFSDFSFDFIIGTDIIYDEDLVENLFSIILNLSNKKTLIMIGYEFRSSSVDDKFEKLFKNNFDIKKVHKSKMHEHFYHDSISLYIMKRKASDFKTGSNAVSI